MYRHYFSTFRPLLHENPLGLPRTGSHPPSQIPRRTGPIAKRPIPHAKKVVVVASGKGGVGKSTVAVNLAFALAMRSTRPRVGILDLDIFGPSIPKLMGLDRVEEPNLTPAGALIPLVNHGLPCMSMGFLLPRSSNPESTDESGSNEDVAVVWRGLMVQKAVQQLLFDVDWRYGTSSSETEGPGLDVLVVDMPPGTGDVPLTLGQLVNVDGAVIVSTPQDVALSDVRKGIAMFRKISVPIKGLILNTSYFLCPTCTTPHHLFGPPTAFHATASRLGVPVLAELPLVPGVSTGGDHGMPYALVGGGGGGKGKEGEEGPGGEKWREGMKEVAERGWEGLSLS